MNDEKKDLVGWTAYEVHGVEVKHYEDWAMSQGPVENNACYGKYKTITDCPNITERDGLEVGDEILIADLLGYWSRAKVTELDLEKGKAYAENEYTVFPLEFGKDERQCWVCSMAMNKAAIQRIELKVGV